MGKVVAARMGASGLRRGPGRRFQMEQHPMFNEPSEPEIVTLIMIAMQGDAEAQLVLLR
jgi:hypothetical protein